MRYRYMQSAEDQT